MGAHADSLGGSAEGDLQFLEVQRCVIGELDMLQVTPHPFVRIQLRRVGRQILDRQPTAVVMHEALDRDRFVRVHVVPDEDDPSPDMAQQMTEKHEYLLGSDAPGPDQDVELPCRAHTGDRRELRPSIAVRQDRCLSSGSPSADSSRDQAEAALVREDQCCFLAAGFFLMRGQSSRIHRRTSASSRSRARPVGRWQDQPHCRRSLGT